MGRAVPEDLKSHAQLYACTHSSRESVHNFLQGFTNPQEVRNHSTGPGGLGGRCVCGGGHSLSSAWFSPAQASDSENTLKCSTLMLLHMINLEHDLEKSASRK